MEVVRFVREEQLRIVDHAAADTCTLELAARHLVDIVIRHIDDGQLAHQFFCTGDLLRLALICLLALQCRTRCKAVWTYRSRMDP